MIYLVCPDCGHRFELVETEGIVCPACGGSNLVETFGELETEAGPS